MERKKESRVGRGESELWYRPTNSLSQPCGELWSWNGPSELFQAGPRGHAFIALQQLFIVHGPSQKGHNLGQVGCSRSNLWKGWQLKAICWQHSQQLCNKSFTDGGFSGTTSWNLDRSGLSWSFCTYCFLSLEYSLKPFSWFPPSLHSDFYTNATSLLTSFPTTLPKECVPSTTLFPLNLLHSSHWFMYCLSSSTIA